ncbi:WhiB family transcriptional regulator [Microbacterium hominis]|uniref:WhiB family transcriptional regulator n=1 Tax=Microbacterium hominis TaxID=162426 RepID=UPI0019642B9B|nr:WhiB family transcriptional regulator [Microbacterium hominis]QRY42077.1 WhiB family transcriptional regulator [Microbacterium hominis]
MDAFGTQTRWLTYAEAARRIGRTDRNIRRWRQEGMPMSWRVGTDNQRERVVDEEVLLKWFREKLNSSPVHQYRMRAIAREHGLPEPVLKAFPKKSPPKPPALLSEARNAEDEKPMKGGPEYRELQRALRETPAPCRDVDEFTAERIDPDTAAKLAGICAGCPVIDLCRAYAERAHPKGYWAGQLLR